ncbi:3-phenylpropionate/trans-cinnamate dioxygenase ferredoxin reductase subunit [Bauldia litoralis]|uniref:3-phenylpropionate/trans-cinnamate dioxygenase ferredoxin reductase subunit n=1 Tax=Bauldia litoralis TaxID=665467 RepID=A0A1G6DUJ8_9HYPH|nr:FAD/NAD(P)-binding oxidoreductase [Bauldia litoralis]SDB48854.1 3-phenylpropionate/trans-cinnamate dioxygenase ferredoxin reductase subunit [Bauldia litoralis]
MFEKGIIVVGGGHGGSQAAASLRAEGYEGGLTLVTAEPDIPYQRPPLSKAFLKEADHNLLPLRPEAFYEKNDITLMLETEATGIDRQAQTLGLSDGSALPFDRLVLAPGSRARMPGIEGIDLDGVLALRNAKDARAIRDRLYAANDVVVVGGGFIGLEIAATARLLGKTVTVLEAAERLMGRVVAPEISAHFLALHRGWGSDIRLATPVGRIVGDSGHVVSVETAAGDPIPADLAIIGIGVIPNVELGKSAGLTIDNGILVDDVMATSVPEIFALGDCATFDHWSLGRRIRLESVQNAVDQAKCAARAILGKPEPFREVPWFWSDQGDVKLQMVGLPFNATRSVTRGAPDSGIFSVFHFDGDRLVAIDSVNRAADHMVGRRLLGASQSPSPESCADESFDLKSLIARPPRG